MATPATVNPFNFYPGRDGLPLQNGYLYFGEPFQDPELQPLQAYWDDANTQPAARPIRTINGYPARNGAPAQVFVGAQYSMRVRDSQGREVFYAPNVTAVDLGGGGLDIITASGGQTVVTLTNAVYTPGSNAIDIALNGIIQISGQDYFETGTNKITMASALSAGDQIRAFARSTFGLTQAVLSDWQAEVFNGAGGASQNFVLTRNPGAVANLDVSVTTAGVGSTLRPLIDYTLSGNTVTITPAPAVGTNNVLIRYGRSLPQDALRGELASTASAADGDALLAVLSPITGAVARTQHQKNQDYISAEDIGAVGDGVTSDRTAFANALAGGKFINLVPGKTYYLGQVTSASAVFTISGVDGCGIRFNGAKVVVQTSGGNYNAPLFSLNNLNGFTLEDPWIEDTGFDQSVTWKGISVVRLHPTSGEVRNVVMRGCRFKGVVAALDADDTTNRAYGLWFDGDVENCYYGVNLGNNGDVAFLNYRTKNAVRSYFCYGIKSHIFNIVSVGHAAAGNADCLIKCKEAALPTRDIKGRFISVGSLATTNPQLVFESQNDSGDAAITDVHVEYNDRQSTGLATSIAFRHFSDAGVLQASDPNTKTNIRVTGYAGAAVSTLSAPTSPQRWLLDDVRPYTVGFRAYLSSTVTNVTGNGATYKPIMTGEEYDTGNDYNTSTGDFTAPWDGYYTFSFSALMTDLSTAATLFDLTLVTTSKTYTNQYGLNISASALQQAASATFSRVFMSAGQTASVRVRVAGMAGDTADLFGDGTIGYTTFSGYQERT